MCKAICYLILFQWLYVIQPGEALFVNKKSLSENIQSGLIFAGKIFGEKTIDLSRHTRLFCNPFKGTMVVISDIAQIK